MKIDFTIEEGGVYPSSAFHSCGCWPDADPPRVPEGGCRCGFYCPNCGVTRDWERKLIWTNTRTGRSMKRIWCRPCGTMLYTYEVELLCGRAQ